ncbi:unnamed protein product [marine sediment metagenome]|uniref:Uncharacterized protein n=1 Tax=marine sediment metagenome TaxID=412755 RepID=X0V9J0_9ZZZZ
MDRMTNIKLREDALALIGLGETLGPEGEGIDIVDREYELQDLVDLKRTLGHMRTAIDVAGRALASAWVQQYGPDASVLLDGEYNYLGATKKLRYQPNMEEAFAAWLVDQDPEIVAKMIPAYGLRKGQVPKGAKDTFFTDEITNDNLRIQSKPQK